jgi:hypothetical protein
VIQHRATASFNHPINPPSLTVAGNYLVHEGESGIWIYADPEASTQIVDVPVDFYLREAREVDLEDKQGVLAFIKRWGMPVDPTNRDVLSDEAELIANAHAVGTLNKEADFHQGRKAAALELGWKPPKATEEMMSLTLNELMTRPGMSEHGAKVAGLRNWVEPSWRLHYLRGFAECIIDPNQADIAMLMDDLNEALTIFAPRIDVLGHSPNRPTIYNIAAAQAANDIYEDTTLLKCKNKECRVIFTKQRGRAEHGAHRTKGVLYCSNSCAKAVAQRALRLRRRNAKNDA